MKFACWSKTCTRRRSFKPLALLLISLAREAIRGYNRIINEANKKAIICRDGLKPGGKERAVKYLWQSADWPRFKWDWAALAPLLSGCRQAQGYLQGKLAILGLNEREASRGQILVEEAVQTSAIEGEKIDLEAVRSSVQRHLGIKLGAKDVRNRKADGLVEMLLDATAKYAEPLSPRRLFGWQAGLFPTGYSGVRAIEVGRWRSGPVYVVSGYLGKEKVHYTAPPAEAVKREMEDFFKWWQESRGKTDGLIRAGLAHLYFVMIHPFADGNGRIARALTDMALAQDEQNGQRFCSLSREIIRHRQAYFGILDRTGKNGLDVTTWLAWFLETVQEAIREGEKNLGMVWGKFKFWQNHEHLELNARQRKVLNKLLEAEPGGFEGGLTTRKYAAMAKVSRATAFREIADLLEKKVIKPRPGKGRSTSYAIKFENIDLADSGNKKGGAPGN
jgi:Fic family protein